MGYIYITTKKNLSSNYVGEYEGLVKQSVFTIYFSDGRIAYISGMFNKFIDAFFESGYTKEDFEQIDYFEEG